MTSNPADRRLNRLRLYLSSDTAITHGAYLLIGISVVFILGAAAAAGFYSMWHDLR